ncbi:AAA ATPase-like protein [Lentzea atacamensis]|uniref:AAA ATPase-like protein n=1 Tax=Lentzea atacamensis TaxID=531938 RepID=A0A316HVE1_9PSEU|nr:ATP-binding protein [Lentzea atacamensis]PWK84387.1 AAA ATPase-like protein [Lentzea atacamensis]
MGLSRWVVSSPVTAVPVASSEAWPWSGGSTTGGVEGGAISGLPSRPAAGETLQTDGGLVGRSSECAALDQVIAAVRRGESRVLVVRGAQGIGKTALLRYLESSATAGQLLRASCVESEMELAYATLHQLCVPLLDRLCELPVPQRQALETVFGMRVGPQPDRFVVGLAVLSLLSGAADGSPVLCAVDDAQQMDPASAQVLGFVARRLPAASIALVFTARGRTQDLLGLPELELTGLGDAHAQVLVKSARCGGLDQHIRDRIVAEAKGNPRALLELPCELIGTQLMCLHGKTCAGPLANRVDQPVLAGIEELSEESRLLLLIVAAEPIGDPTLVWRAAARLGVTSAAALTAEVDGLLSFDVRVTFRHPHVRSAVYRAAAQQTRRAVHQALAEVADPHDDLDRCAWHLAAAFTEPNEAVAAELEQSARRAFARGGLVTAAVFLQRALALTPDSSPRAERAVAAAHASVLAGDLETAKRLVDFMGIDDRNEFLDQLERGCSALAAVPFS